MVSSEPYACSREGTRGNSDKRMHTSSLEQNSAESVDQRYVAGRRRASDVATREVAMQDAIASYPSYRHQPITQTITIWLTLHRLKGDQTG